MSTGTALAMCVAVKKLLLLPLFIFLGSLTAQAKETVIVLVTSQDVFYFEVGKLMKDGQVEIYDPAGKLITSQQVTKRSTTIELLNLPAGEYIIKVVKDSKDQSFEYVGGKGKARVAMRDEITISLKIEEVLKFEPRIEPAFVSAGQ